MSSMQRYPPNVYPHNTARSRIYYTNDSMKECFNILHEELLCKKQRVYIIYILIKIIEIMFWCEIYYFIIYYFQIDFIAHQYLFWISGMLLFVLSFYLLCVENRFMKYQLRKYKIYFNMSI